MHDFATVHIPATEERRVNRGSVVRMVSLYVYLHEHSGLKAGRALTIDDSLIIARRGYAATLDLDGLTLVQGLDEFERRRIHYLAYAKPERRTDVRTTDGELMLAVAPAEDLAHVVQIRGVRRHRSIESRARTWMESADAKIGKLPKKNSVPVVRVEEIRFDQVELRNRSNRARSDVQRMRSGGRNARNLRRHAEERAAEWRSRERLASDELIRTVRSKVYKDGLDLLWSVCTETPEIEAYLFGGD